MVRAHLYERCLCPAAEGTEYCWGCSKGHLHLQLPISPGAGGEAFVQWQRIQEVEGACAGQGSTAFMLAQHAQLVKWQGLGNNLSF